MGGCRIIRKNRASVRCDMCDTLFTMYATPKNAILQIQYDHTKGLVRINCPGCDAMVTIHFNDLPFDIQQLVLVPQLARNQ